MCSPSRFCKIKAFHNPSTRYFMTSNHLDIGLKSKITIEVSLTVLVRVLNTRIFPEAVPMKMNFPEGSNRATVIGNLMWNNKREFSMNNANRTVHAHSHYFHHLHRHVLPPLEFPRVLHATYTLSAYHIRRLLQ